MYQKAIFCILFVLLSCNNPKSSTIIKIEKSNIKSVFNKRLNLVFIWTTWCGVSNSILKETYTYLQNDTNEYNIIIICGNNDLEGIQNKFSSLDLNYKKYIIGNSSNILPIMDRKNIKEFISKEFKNTKNLKLEGNFGIPLSFLVDSSLNILNSNMPQDTTNIKIEINKY